MYKITYLSFTLSSFIIHSKGLGSKGYPSLKSVLERGVPLRAGLRAAFFSTRGSILPPTVSMDLWDSYCPKEIRSRQDLGLEQIAQRVTAHEI